MAIPSVITHYLNDKAISYQTLVHDACRTDIALATHLNVPEQQLLRCVQLSGGSKRFLAILPSNHLLDLEILVRLKNTELILMSESDRTRIYAKCDPGCFPPLAELFSLSGLVDESVFQLPCIYFRSGDNKQIIKIEQAEIARLFQQDERLSFSCGPEKLHSYRSGKPDTTEVINQFTPIRIKQRIDETFDLPAMPEIAQEIMRLRVDPHADAKRLGQIVAKDPSLAAQILSWASSPYYGYKGTVDSVETAISRVLGFDLVMNLALGISIGKSLNVPEEGPLGIKAFWRQSVYTANLVEKLNVMIPAARRPERGLVYLSGLLHNFGHLLLGHLFPPQFKLINRYIETNSSILIEDIEHFVLGVSHQEIGAWLMHNWHMPEELVVAVRWHHQEEFVSQHAMYSNLVLLASRLLNRINMGDAAREALPPQTLEYLSLSEQQVNEGFNRLLEEAEALDHMSKQLVA